MPAFKGFVQGPTEDGFEVLAHHDAQTTGQVQFLVGDKIMAYIGPTDGKLHIAQMTGGPASVGLSSADGAHVDVVND
jgi:hypothetical protein